MTGRNSLIYLCMHCYLCKYYVSCMWVVLFKLKADGFVAYLWYSGVSPTGNQFRY